MTFKGHFCWKPRVGQHLAWWCPPHSTSTIGCYVLFIHSFVRFTSGSSNNRQKQWHYDSYYHDSYYDVDCSIGCEWL